ncbi:MAG TPA: response regulator [Dissulfurispiraceae bacterium]|nr:response regulator [Dissulfurispiraceae bacterium]
MQTSNILIVDDEKSVLEALKRSFIDDPYEIHSAQSAEEGLRLLSAMKTKVVISDEMMPGMSGADFLAKVSSNFPRVIRIMLTGHASLAAAVKAINKGEIYRFFTKPWDDFELRFAVKTAVEKFDLEEENSRLLETIKKQALNLKLIEKEFPGITQLEYDRKGRIVVRDVSDDDVELILAQLEKEYGS